MFQQSNNNNNNNKSHKNLIKRKLQEGISKMMRRVEVPGACNIFLIFVIILEKYISIYESVRQYNNNNKL